MLWTVIVILVVLVLMAVIAARVARSRGRRTENTPTVAEAAGPPPPSSGASRAQRADVDSHTANPGHPRVGVRPGPYPESSLPGPDGSAPAGEFLVKADEATKRYYTPGVEDYQHLRADLWFSTAADADAAGFRPVHQ